jgi:hypothetical protein
MARQLSNQASESAKIVTIEGSSPSQVPVPVDVCFVGRSDPSKALTENNLKCLKQENVIASPTQKKTLVAPRDSVAVSVAGKTFLLNKLINPVGVTVKSRPTVLKGFWWALGGKRGVDVQSVGAVNLAPNS